MKGRFQSLKELRVKIKQSKDLVYATAWINACIVLHAFCLDQELDIDQEWLKDGQQFERDLQSGRPQTLSQEPTQELRNNALNEKKATRENLKQLLLASLN